MRATIEWNTLSPADWEKGFALIRRSNILQSYEYARAVCPLQKQKGCWGLIKIDGTEAGLVQILEAGALCNLIHAAVLDRGPLWFDGYGNAAHFESFLAALRKKFPKRFGRRMRFIPEAIDTIAPMMEKYGFKRQDTRPYQTIWLDLRKSEEELRADLKKNWRNMLARAEKEGITTAFDQNPELLKDCLTNYATEKAAKGFDGPGVEYLIALCKTFFAKRCLVLGRALDGKNILGYALFFIHGKSATYQVGWTSAQGRKNGSQNKLLMDACFTLKNMGITDLDLGGVNDETAKGVKTFKEGMGGELFTGGGLYY